MKRHRIAAEFFGTFFLVFAGTGAMVINDQGGQITHLGVALVFGLVVLTLIYAFGEISGAHFNPAVTLAFAASKRFRKEEVFGYLLAQFAGGFAASGFLRVLFPSHASIRVVHAIFSARGRAHLVPHGGDFTSVDRCS